MRSFFIIPIAISFILGGCASGMDSAECVTADWRAIGFEDGSQGRGGSSIASRRKACAEHGVTPDFEAYMAGRDTGLAQYCRPRNGYRLGARGVRYSGVCSPEQEPAFQEAHTEGYGLYQRRVTVSKVAKRLRDRKRRADKIEYELVETTAQLVNAGVAISKRAAMGVKIKQLADEKSDVELTINDLEQEYATAKQEYKEYRIRIALRRGG
jgi:hypothetical protein